MGSVVIVGCVAGKAPAAAPARALYRGQLWAARRGYAEASGRPWFVLSAMHGIVRPDDVVAPYDRRVADLRPAARKALAVSAALRLLRWASPADLELHAGADYAAFLVDVLGEVERFSTWRPAVELPLAGLGIGRQLGWYRTRRVVGEPVVVECPACGQLQLGSRDDRAGACLGCGYGSTGSLFAELVS